MQSFLITKNNHLTTQELTDLASLVESCRSFDEADSKIYWDIIKHKREVVGNFLCYREKVLIGYFSYFLFEENAVHVSAMVRPSDRRQGVFLRLFHAACLEIIKLGINRIIFSFPKKNQMARECLLSLAAHFQSVEYCMQRSTHLPEAIDNSLLSINKGNVHDVELLARIDSACFDSDYSIMLQRFKETILDPDRQVWIAYLGSVCIGKCHVQFEQGGAYIHDVCILPRYQKNGYGTCLLKLVINQLINMDCYQMSLDVTTSNEFALRLYQNCQFKIVNIYEYWCVDR